MKSCWGGTCTATSEASTSTAALAVAWLLPPTSAKTSWPDWASPGMTYDPPDPALPWSSVRKQLTSRPGSSFVRPT